AIQSLACTKHNTRSKGQIPGFQSTSAKFNLGDETRFGFKVRRIAGDGRQTLVIAYAKYDRASNNKVGDYFRISNDGGVSYEPELALPGPSEEMLFAVTHDSLVAFYGTDPQGGKATRNITSARMKRGDANWSEPVQVNDEQDSVVFHAG